MTTLAASGRRLGAHPTLLLVVVATLAHLLLWVALPDSLGADESSDLQLFYEPVAESLVDGDGFTTRDGEPAVRYPPGFPALIAPIVAVADTTGWARADLFAAVTALTMGLSCGVVHLIGRRLFGPTVAVVGALLWLAWPLGLWLAKQPNSEVPGTLLLLLAVLATVRAAQRTDAGLGDAACAGAAIAGAALVRPAVLVLLVPLGIWLWVQRRRLHPAARPALPAVTLVGVAGLAILPWVVWASSAHGSFVPLATGGRDTVVDGLEVGIDQKGTEGGRTLGMPAELRGLLQDLSAQEGDGDLPTTGSVVTAVAREVPERPVAVLQLVGFKAVRSWYGTESLRYERPLALVQLATAALLVVGSVRCWRGGDQRRAALGLLLGVLGTSWLLTMAVLSIVRYLTPALGLALLLVAVALEPLVERARARWRSAFGTPTPVAGGPPG